MKSNLRLRRSLTLASFLLVVAAITPIVEAASNPNPGVFPTSSKPYGITYGQWSAKWWQWAFSIPSATNPLLDSTGANCGVSQSGPVWFLAGTFGGSTTRSCTVSSNKSILFPIINTECSTIEGNPPPGSTLSGCAKYFMDLVTALGASVDGRALKSLTTYRVQSPSYTFTLPSDNILGISGCPCSSPSEADGFWIIVQPLEAGTHTVHFEAAIPAFSFTVDVTYTLTIVE